MTDAPWSTIPVTGAQHDAWMAEERDRAQYPARVSVWSWNPMITDDPIIRVWDGLVTKDI